jgi:hypothetical protein
MVFFKNSNCEGTPATQANTVSFHQPGCVEIENDNGSINYGSGTLQKYAVGNPFDTHAAKFVDFIQTDTCDSAGIERNYYFKSGDCMNYSSTEIDSNKFVVNDGTVIMEIYPCANCACAVMSTGTLPQNECEVDTEGPDEGDDGLFDDAQLVSSAGYNENRSSSFSYALPQTCLWSTGCSNSPGGKRCEIGTYCKEYQWWSQCLENTVDNSKPQIANPSKKCISTRNGHGPNAHWGCSVNADCCNPQAVCNTFSRTCNLPCEAMDEPEPLSENLSGRHLVNVSGKLSASNDAALSGSSMVVLVPVVAGVGLFAILASLSLYYFICRRGASTKSQDYESQSELTVIVDSETEVHVLE